MPNLEGGGQSYFSFTGMENAWQNISIVNGLGTTKKYRLTETTDSRVPSTYMTRSLLNCRYNSTTLGIAFFESAMYVTRFWAALEDELGVGTSKAAKNGSVMHSARSLMTRDGEPCPDRSRPASVSKTIDCGDYLVNRSVV